MKILLATGIYPPQIGGPATYATNLREQFITLGHRVRICTFSLEHHLPAGIRHIYFFVKIFFVILFFSPDFVLALDTFSVGVPSVLVARLLRRKVVIRTGGDFLWEGYVERTGNLILLRDFYIKIKSGEVKLSLKERIIFGLTRWTVRNCNLLVFSTIWQRGIWREPYRLSESRTAIIENHFAPIETETAGMVRGQFFLSGGRQIKLKNWSKLKHIFSQLNLPLEILSLPREQFLESLRQSYALILISVSEISPNLVLDAMRYGKPVILTQETGLRERLGDTVIWVDPNNEEDIKNKILWLMDESNYRVICERIKNFRFTHSWEEIVDEFVKLFQTQCM